MLLREDDRGVLAIGQPSHAWISGQLARAWGNERFGTVDPFEEVCLAAEQHDVGWSTLDLEPIYNSETGLPRSFIEVALETHLGIWREGPRSLLSQSRYAAMLASMHGRRLYERRDLRGMPSAQADSIRRFLSGQEAFETELKGLLRADPASAPWASEELIERNSMLIWTWDYLSLALCHGWPSASAKNAPTADGSVDLKLSQGDQPGTVQLGPWPFAADSVTVRCEGRRLEGRFESEKQMRAALAAASWETLRVRLAPATGG